MTEMQGVRVYPNADGWLDPNEISKPGAYGKVDAKHGGSRVSWWQVTAPDGHAGCLDPKIHTVVEHDDGTITVTPSIDMSHFVPGGFHGWLTAGVWRSC